MTSNRNALAIGATDYARTGGPFDRIELEDGTTTTRITAWDTGILPRPETDTEVLERRTRADHDAQEAESAAEHAALTAEMDALPVATYVIVTAVDGLPLDGGEDVGTDLAVARDTMERGAKACAEHVETHTQHVDVLMAMHQSRTAQVGTILHLPGGVTITLALRRA